MGRPGYLTLPILAVPAAIEYVYYTTVFVAVAGWLGLATAAGVANAAVFTALAAVCVATYAIAVCQDPGRMPPGFLPDVEDAETPVHEVKHKGSICADAASFDLLPNNLTSCIAEAQKCIQLCSFKRSIENFVDKQFDPENYAILKGEPNELVIESKELGYTKPGNYIYEFLPELNITSETSKKLIETIDSASLLLEEGNSGETKAGVRAKATVSRLETIRDMLDIIFRGGGQSHAKYYRFHVNESQQTYGDGLQVLEFFFNLQHAQKRLAVLNKCAKSSCSCISLLLSVLAIVILAVIVLLLVKRL